MKIGSNTAWFALIVCCRWCWSPSVSVAGYRKGNEKEQLGSSSKSKNQKSKPRIDVEGD
jgi:hypothetical protein